MTLLHARRTCALVLAAAACAGLSACGSDDNSSSGSGSASTPESTSTATPEQAASGGQQLKIAATESDGLGFTEKSLKAKAGKVTLTMANPSQNKLPHAIELEGKGVEEEGETISPGEGDSTVTVDLKPGKYEFYCPVGGHRDAGMEGELTVG